MKESVVIVIILILIRQRNFSGIKFFFNFNNNVNGVRSLLGHTAVLIGYQIKF